MKDFTTAQLQVQGSTGEEQMQDSWPKLANRRIPCHEHHAPYLNRKFLGTAPFPQWPPSRKAPVPFPSSVHAPILSKIPSPCFAGLTVLSVHPLIFVAEGVGSSSIVLCVCIAWYILWYSLFYYHFIKCVSISTQQSFFLFLSFLPQGRKSERECGCFAV